MAMQVKFPFGRFVSVLVSHVDETSGDFFVQITDEAGKLESLMSEIEQAVQTGSSKTPRSQEIAVGSVYLAQYPADSLWYRARVLGVNPGQHECEVFFFDYGNTDTVPVSCLRIAEERFCELPPQSFECELHGVDRVKGDRFEEAVTLLNDTILEQELFCKAVLLRKNCVVVVELFTDEKGTDSIFEKIDACFATGAVSLDKVQARIPRESDLQREVKYDLMTLPVDSFHDLLVSWVEDPSHFWCQLISKSDTVFNLTEDIAAEYATLGPDALPLRSCTVGYPCCAKYYEEDTWNRGIITNVNSIAAGQIEVRFVDYGNSQKTALSDVRDLKDKFLKLPCQAMHFTTAGVDPNSKDGLWADEAKVLFEKLIKDKHVVGLVIKLETDGRHKVTLIDTTTDLDMELNQILIAANFGVKSVEVASPTTLPTAIKSTESSPKPAPQPVFSRENVQVGKEEQVLVTNIVDPSKFFCELFRNGPKLETLMQDVGRHYSKLGANEELLSSPSPGDPCCAQFTEDGCWYRAVVVDSSSKGVTVQYIDYGNSETLPAGKIKKLIPKFSDLPQQAIECTLNRIKPKFIAGQLKWRACDAEKFRELALEKEGKMTVVAEDSSGVKRVELVVKVKKEEQNISEQLLIGGNATLADGALPASENWTNVISHTLPAPDLKVGHFEDVVVTYIEHPGNFWCQLRKSADELTSLMEELSEQYALAGQKNSISHPACGMLCCAQYTEDDMWYRGQITGVKKGGLVEVHFVDYGNYESLPLSRVKVLKTEYMKLPLQAVHCNLAKLHAPDELLLADSIMDAFHELTLEKELVMMADKLDEKSGMYAVVLLDTSEGKNLDIAAELQSVMTPLKNREAVHIPGLDLEPGTTEDVFVSSVTSAEKFFCQLINTSDSLDELMGEMAEYYSNLTELQDGFTKPVVGEFCAAKFTLDDSWYRAQISGVQGNQLTVHYVDFGNSETLQLSRVKVLNSKFQSLPIQAIECSCPKKLSGISGAKFQEFVSEKEFTASVLSVKGGVAEVDLKSNETEESVCDILTKEGSHEVSPVPTCRVANIQWNAGDKVQIFVPYVESAQKFFCQVSQHSNELDELMNRLEEHYSTVQESVTSITAGSFCVALYAEGGWYRARVTQVQGDSVEVLYIDYGDTAIIPLSSIRTLTTELSSLPAQAVQCCLKGFSTSPGPVEFKELIIEQEFEAQVIGVKNGFFEIELVSNDGAVSQMLAKGAEVSTTPVSNVTNIQWNAGEKAQVFIPYVESAQKFFCQVSQHSNELDELMNRLEKHYSAVQESVASISAGSFCVALYAEGGWYRARVTQVQGGSVKVFYIDYGDTAIVPLSSIRTLTSELSSLPAQAVQCCLKGFSISPGPAEFKDLIIEQEFEAQVINVKNGFFEIELVSNDGAVSQMLAKGAEVSTTPVSNVTNIQWNAGEKAQVFIPYVESAQKFFCQVSQHSNELDELMNRLEEHYSAVQESVASISAGSFCVALYAEGGWYRARVTQVQGGSVEVFYIDYGDMAIVPLSSIRTLTTEFSSLPAQAVQCCLKGFSTSPGPAEFKELIIEQEFEAQVIGVNSSSVYEVELVSKESSAVVSQMLSRVKEPGPTPLVEISEGTFVDLCPTACVNPHHFFCQIMTAERKDNLEQLMNQLQECYSVLGAQEQSMSNPCVGMHCAAVFADDDMWYRGKVTKVLDNQTVEVYYLDYGNIETVPLNKVKTLTEDWTAVAAHAVKCSIPSISPVSGTEWPRISVERFTNLTVHKQLVGKITKKVSDGSLELELFDTTDKTVDIDIGDTLVKEGLACHSGPGTTKPVSVCKPLASLGRTKLSSKEKVFVTAVESPGCFYCQVSGSEAKLDTLMKQIATAYDPLPKSELSVDSISPGDVCCARFTEDDQWYRAAVEEQTADAVTVRFIDYGNAETLPTGRVKILKDDFISEPPLAVQCSLCGVQPTGSQVWAVEAGQTFEELTSEKVLEATFVSSSEPFDVELMDNGMNIAEELIKAKLALATKTAAKDTSPTKEPVGDFKSPSVECGEMYDVYITSISSAGKFYCQLVNMAGQLDGMMNDLNDHYFQLAETEGCVISPTVGQPCVAIFEEMWYRAKVCNMSVNDLTVHYVDYGNTETVRPSSVKQITPLFLKTPMVAIECSLDLSRAEWSEDATTLLEELTGTQMLTIKVVSRQDDQYEVKLFGEGAHCISSEVLNTLKETGERQVKKEKEALKHVHLQAGQEEQLYVVHTESAEEFYIQLSKTYPELEQMMEEIAEVYSGLADDVRPEDLVVGAPCCALFTEDGRWYRAVIKSIASDFEVEVHYVDYGNSAVVLLSDIRDLSRRFFTLPVQAILCCLDCPADSFSPEAASFKQQVDDKELLGRFLALEGKKWKVRLFEGDRRIAGPPSSSVVSAAMVGDPESFFEINEYVQPTIIPEMKDRVYICHVVSPDEFYVQFESMLDDLTSLSQEITQFYSGLDPSSHVLHTPCAGMSCCAKFSEDSEWYRGRINSVVPSGVDVKFVDYGNGEVVDFSDVKEIDKRFVQLPQQSILCGLDVTKDSWTAEEVGIFNSVALDKSLNARFIICDGQMWRVSLEMDGGSVVDMFMTKDAAVLQQAGSDVSGVQTRSYLPAVLSSGQMEEVYVSHITESGDFYVQLSKTVPELSTIENLVNEMYEGLVPVGEAMEVCFVDSLCCAKFSDDGRWYRAVVTKVVSDSLVGVVFVDYGNSEAVNVGSVRQLRPELLDCPVQAIKCRLEGSKEVWTASDVEQFEASVLDKPLHVTFARQEGSSWFVTIKELDMFRAAPSDKLKSFAKESFQSNKREEAYFLSADSPDCVWLQPAKTGSALEELMAQIAVEVTDQPLVESQVTKGLACLGCFTDDDAWYRAQVVEVGSGMHVMYVDFGNSEWLPLDRLRPISDSALLLPAQAICCSLSGVQGIEPTKVTKYLNETLVDGVLEVEATTREDGSTTVVLYHQGVPQSVNEQIVGECLGDTSPSQEAQLTQASPSAPIAAQERRAFKLPDLQQGSRVSVSFVSAFLPTKIQLLLTERMEERDQVTRNITSLYDGLDDNALHLESAEVGQVCCVQFSREESECVEWFRSELLSISADGSATAKLVDYGNCEKIPLASSRVLKDELLKAPVHVVEGSLAGICPSSEDGQWSPECSSVIESLCKAKALVAEIVQVAGDTLEFILYDDSGKSVNQSLVDLGIAKEVESCADFSGEPQSLTWPHLDVGQRLSVNFVAADDLESVHLQFADTQAELFEMMGNISVAYSPLGDEDLAIGNPQVGQVCCAQYSARYSKDFKWHRAVITAVSNDGVTVKFVDYGNIDVAVAIKQLKDEFFALPVQSLECRLKGVVLAPDRSKAEVAVKLAECCDFNLLTAEVTKVSGDSVEINLYFSSEEPGNSVAGYLMKLGLGVSPPSLQQPRRLSISEDGKMVYNHPELEVGCRYGVSVLRAKSPSHFWCRLNETGTELEFLSQKIALFYQSLGENDLRVLCLQVGDLCCAQFIEDGKWYRSQVAELCSDSKVCVHSVDYGKQETLSLERIKKLDAKFAVLPVQAVHCSLCSLEQPHKYYGEDWSEGATSRFQELCTEPGLTVEVVGAKGDIFLVELLDAKNYLIGDKLLSEGFAVEIKPVLAESPVKGIFGDKLSPRESEGTDGEPPEAGHLVDSDSNEEAQEAAVEKEQIESEVAEEDDDDDDEFQDSTDQMWNEPLGAGGEQITAGEAKETEMEKDATPSDAPMSEASQETPETEETEKDAEQSGPAVEEEAVALELTEGLSEEQEDNRSGDITPAEEEIQHTKESENIASDEKESEEAVQFAEDSGEVHERHSRGDENEEEEEVPPVEESQDTLEECLADDEMLTEEGVQPVEESRDLLVESPAGDEMPTEEEVHHVEERQDLLEECLASDEMLTEEEVHHVEESQEVLEEKPREIESPETVEEPGEVGEEMKEEAPATECCEADEGPEKAATELDEQEPNLGTPEAQSLSAEAIEDDKEEKEVRESLEMEEEQEAKQEESVESEEGSDEVSTEEGEKQDDEFMETQEGVAEGFSEEDLTAITESSNGTEKEDKSEEERVSSSEGSLCSPPSSPAVMIQPGGDVQFTKDKSPAKEKQDNSPQK